MQDNTAITVTDITKKYGKTTAVDAVSFTVAEGEFFGFLGPNGAGKTTLIRIAGDEEDDRSEGEGL